MTPDPTQAPGEQASLRAFRALFRVYPRAFRDEFEKDAALLFRDQCREVYGHKGLLALGVHWARTIAVLLWNGCLERAAGRSLSGVRPSLRQAVGSLRRDPALTIVAGLSLAIGIGASTALFSLLNAVLFEPLPFPEPERLVQIWESNPSLDLNEEGPSPLNVADWSDATTLLEGIAAWYLTSGTHRDASGAEEIRGAQVTSDFFRVLGWEVALGRTPVADEVNGYGPVVLSDGLWRRRYGANPDLIGQFITISGRPYEVAGVMPAGFTFPDPSVELWLAWDLRDVYATNPDSRSWRFLRAVGRMRPGASLEAVQSEMAAIAAGLSRDYPGDNDGWSVRVRPLHEQVVGSVRPPLYAAFGAVSLILLMACVNVANLLLARVPVRSRELAVRRALGAGRTHTALQLLLENALLGAMGGLGGLAVAWCLVRLLMVFDAGNIPRLDEVGIDPGALGFAAGVAMLATLTFGLAPTLQAARVSPSQALREGSGATGAASAVRLRRALVAGQIALATILVAGAGLFSASLSRLNNVDPGFDASGAVSFRISLDPQGEGPAYVAPYYEGLMERLAGLQGVQAAGAVQTLPLNPVGNDFTRPFRSMGTDVPTAEAPMVQMRIATPGYLDALGMRLVAGTWLSGDAAPEAPLVAVVNQTLAARLWPGISPVGETFEIDFRGGWRPYTVVGVVGDTRHYGLRSDARPEVYLAHRQSPYVAMTVVLRSDSGVRVLERSVNDAVRAYGPAQPIHHFVTLERLLDDATATERFLVVLLSAFGAIGVLLACTGVFGVMSYLVGQRSRELGLRVALGAGRSSLLRMVMGGAMALAACGVVTGLLVSLALGAWVRALLFDVSPWDPVTLGGVSALLFAAALSAALIPARRATEVDPALVLRGD